MIGYLNGKVKLLKGGECIVDVNGVGYRVSIDAASAQSLKVGASTELYIHTAVREDAITLYGFKTQAALDFFETLLTVNGVGAKSALAIVAKISAADFATAVARQDLSALVKLPGIGKKSAQRLLLELKDKVAGFADNSDSGEFKPAAIPANSFEEASEALSALGYTSAEISAVLRRAPKNATTEQLIKSALKELNRFA